MQVGDLIKWISWDKKQQVGIIVRKHEDSDLYSQHWQVLGAAGLLFCREADMKVINAGR